MPSRSFCMVLFSATLLAQPAAKLRPFTIEDEIRIAHFGDPYSAGMDPIFLSPDGALAAVFTERGLPSENRVQDEIRIYSVDALRRFVNTSDGSGAIEPLWQFTKENKEGRVIDRIRWLPDSSQVAFLVRDEKGGKQIWLGDVQHRTLKALTPLDQDVTDFDVRDGTHFAYTVSSFGKAAEMMSPKNVPAFSATGLSLNSPLMFSPDDPDTKALWNRSELWAATGGKPVAVHDAKTGLPIAIYTYDARDALSIAPDGNFVATFLPLEHVPEEWGTRYAPPPGIATLRREGGHQDLTAPQGRYYVSEFVTVDLRSGMTLFLTDAPESNFVGWPTVAKITWSPDSRSILLPGTFLASWPRQPACLAIGVPYGKSFECAQPLRTTREELIRDIRFDGGRTDRLIVEYSISNGPRKTRILTRSAGGKWEAIEETEASNKAGIEVTVKQGLNFPPVLIVTDHATQKSRMVWDLNPQLKEMKFRDVEVYRWKDATGRDWRGGLYKPVDYVPGHRYPLVIQTHGFVESEFRPSGVYPTAFAARALAAQGIAVLQIANCPIIVTPDEGPCQVRGYESAVKRLDADGLIDPDRVGIIGFSRTCFYVMQALTTSSLHFKAASITDGVNEGYWQYLLTTDYPLRGIQNEADAMIGAPPLGEGLQEWLKRSPEFNADKVTTPLQVVAKRGHGTLFMWEPYALLRIEKKPVDLLILNTSQHVLTNPGVRLASQGGSVDWFRFWLQDYEDPAPEKAAQYARWRELRTMDAHDRNAIKSGPVQ